MRYKTEEQFIREYLLENASQVKAWKHIMSICKMCIRAHPVTLKEAKRVAKMNKHLIGK